MMTDPQGYLTTPQQKDAPPCPEVLQVTSGMGSGFLTCNLKLRYHKAHHDPSGTWWIPCTLTGHTHEEGEVRAPVQEADGAV